MLAVPTRNLMVLGLFLFSFSAFADQTMICKNGVAERKIEVISTEGSKLPCVVKYFKDVSGEGMVLWSAKNDPSYCENKAKEFTDSLVSYGWECTLVGATAKDIPVSETVKTESILPVEPAKK